MTAQEILERYQSGRETPTGVILEVLNLTNREAVIELLKMLPKNILRQLKNFVGYYSPSVKVFRGPIPQMGTVQIVKNWFSEGHIPPPLRHLPSETKQLRTIPIANDADFRDLQKYADSVLRSKGYELIEQKGSSSWIDPTDSMVRFKLSKCRTGLFFGVRQEWANILGLSVKQLGEQSVSFSPSSAVFRGYFVTNSLSGRQEVENIAKAFPFAGHLPSKLYQVAANFGDRMKQALLLEIFSRTDEWGKTTYTETHAGAGAYCQSAQKMGPLHS